jgi:hypothetical protein
VLAAFLVAMYALAVYQGDGLSALLLGCAVMVLALRATTECAAAMAAVIDVVAAPELDAVDALPERHGAEFVAVGGRRALTPAVNGGSAAGAEALRAELRIGRRGGTP